MAATNAVHGPTLPGCRDRVQPLRQLHRPRVRPGRAHRGAGARSPDVVVGDGAFDALPRPIIDGRTFGFCKLIVGARELRILGCHVVGERAVELAQLAAIAMTAGMTGEQLARARVSFPTYANAMARAAIKAARELDPSTTSTEDQFPPQAGLPAT